MCLTILELLFRYLLTDHNMFRPLFLVVWEVDPLCFILLVVWALNAIRWCDREYIWTRIGRSCSLMLQRMTLGRLTTPKRGVFTSEHVPLRSVTLSPRGAFPSESLVEDFVCQRHL